MRTLGRAVAAAALLLGSAPAATGAPVAALAAASSGECSTTSGVTVVVDFTDLGGGVVVRCAGSGAMTGVQALGKAGFSVAGTQRQGLAFVCRIDGRPKKDEELAMDGDPDYTEQCVDTPPANAYWGYWYATDGGSWKYSSTGPGSHQAIEGGYEGWRFELNRSSDALPPGYTPVRTPATASPTPTASATKKPAAGATASPSSTPSKQPGRRPTPSASRTPRPSPSEPGSTPTGSPTQSPVAAPAVDDVASPAAGSSAAGTLVALAVIGAVALAGGGVAWRRSRRP